MKRMKKIEVSGEKKMLYAGILCGGITMALLSSVISVFEPDLKGVFLLISESAVFFGAGYGLGKLKSYMDTYRKGYSDGRKRGREENTNILQMKVENRSVVFPDGKAYYAD